MNNVLQKFLISKSLSEARLYWILALLLMEPILFFLFFLVFCFWWISMAFILSFLFFAALNLSLKGSHENTAKPRQSPQQQQQRHHHHQQQQHHHKSTPTPPPPPPPPPPPVPTPQQKLKPKQQQQHHQHSDPHSESIDPTHPRFPLVKHSNLLNRNADQ